MIIASILVAAAVAVSSPLGVAPTATLPDSIVRRIDAVFAPYDHPDVPGCAVGVYQNGAIAFERGYGSANLEYGVPITPTTPFIMGSVSKQFTAAAIALLVEQGRLSLDDDVRKYIPELPDYGKRITIDELVHHTSGLRDFWALVGAAGMRWDDTYAVSDVLALAERQKHLEFAPGTAYDYSNTGYVILGEIVRRVSGRSLARFAAEEIFAPLGMTHTHFQDDHTVIVPGRAYAYTPAGRGGWRIDVWNNDIVGQGGLMTTVEDLQKWDENFYTGQVGGPRFLAQQLVQGRLADGTVLRYAFGLEVGTYRGLRLVEHTGSTGGYRTIISRFPSAHTSVVALCNASNVNTTTLSHQVADAVLASAFTQPPPAAPVAAAPAVRLAAAKPRAMTTPAAARFAARYHSDELDATFVIRDSVGTLVLDRPRRPSEALTPVNAHTFRADDMTLTFGAAGFMLDVGRARGIEFLKLH
ncbi:MAG TPA: serine hydrolase domain-containing protein [Gemmatimonadaceae bacterium]|nr:serine hydrolase domain-containing protein [Gemmatimonadaceae bacterium]